MLRGVGPRLLLRVGAKMGTSPDTAISRRLHVTHAIPSVTFLLSSRMVPSYFPNDASHLAEKYLDLHSLPE